MGDSVEGALRVLEGEGVECSSKNGLHHYFYVPVPGVPGEKRLVSGASAVLGMLNLQVRLRSGSKVSPLMLELLSCVPRLYCTLSLGHSALKLNTHPTSLPGCRACRPAVPAAAAVTPRAQIPVLPACSGWLSKPAGSARVWEAAWRRRWRT